jgi:hypothetical protein
VTALTFATALEQFNAEFAPVCIPPIADFAREIERDLSGMELERDEFFARVDALAAKPACPTLCTITYAGEYLNDCVLARCDAPELTDEETNAWAAMAMEFSPEFRNEFAHFYKDGILAQMDDERAERGRVSNKQTEGDWE